MIAFPAGAMVWSAGGVTDMRRGMNTLAPAVRQGAFAPSANRPANLRIYPERLVVAAVGKIPREQERLIQRCHHLPPRTICDWRHGPAVIQRKPGALRNGAPFVEVPSMIEQLQDQMLRKPDGDRKIADLLALVLHHDEQAVPTPVEIALDAGVPTKIHLLNLLHRLIDGKTTGGPDIDTPQALVLRHEPAADLDRHDG